MPRSPTAGEPGRRQTAATRPRPPEAGRARQTPARARQLPRREQAGRTQTSERGRAAQPPFAGPALARLCRSADLGITSDLETASREPGRTFGAMSAFPGPARSLLGFTGLWTPP